MDSTRYNNSDFPLEALTEVYFCRFCDEYSASALRVEAALSEFAILFSFIFSRIDPNYRDDYMGFLQRLRGYIADMKFEDKGDFLNFLTQGQYENKD